MQYSLPAPLLKLGWEMVVESSSGYEYMRAKSPKGRIYAPNSDRFSFRRRVSVSSVAPEVDPKFW